VGSLKLPTAFLFYGRGEIPLTAFFIPNKGGKEP
jgi:hypothetical protein